MKKNAKSKATDEDSRLNTVPALLVIPDGLEIPPWNAAAQTSEDLHDVVPLSCQRLPSGMSLLVRNMRLLKEAPVDQIFVLVRSELMDVVQSHLKDRKNRRLLKGLNWEAVPLSKDSDCIGEALREVSRHSSLTSCHNRDFILMFADVVCRANLTSLLESHRRFKKKQGACVMTRLTCPLVARKEFRDSVPHPKFDNRVALIDTETGQIYATTDLTGKSHIVVDKGKILADKQFRIVLSMESGVDICSPQLLEVLRESFDYRHLQPDFIQGTVSKELTLETIHAVIDEGSPNDVLPACLRVPTPEHLFAIWALSKMDTGLMECLWKPPASSDPVTEGKQETGGSINVEDYLNLNTLVAPTACIKPGVVIRDSVVLGGVVIEEEAECVQCFLSEGALIERQCKVKGLVLPPNCAVRKRSDGAIFFGKLDDASCEVARPRPFRPDELNGLKGISVPSLSLADFIGVGSESESSESDSDSEAESSEEAQPAPRSPADRFAEDGFFEEVYTMALEGMRKIEHMPHKLLEIKSFRLASNRRPMECVPPMVKAFVDGLVPLKLPLRDVIARMDCASFFTSVAPLDDEMSQLVVLDSVFRYTARPEIVVKVALDDGDDEESCTESVFPNPLCSPAEFCRLVRLLATADALDEDVLPQWAKASKDRSLPVQLGRYTLDDYLTCPEMQRYLSWLEQAEEATDSD